MLGAIKNIFNILSSLINLIITLITSFLDLLIKIPTYISMLISFIEYLPTQFKAFALVFVSTSIIMFIIGRNRGGSN